MTDRESDRGHPATASRSSVVDSLVSAFRTLGGQIVINQSLALDRSSYRTEVQALIAARLDTLSSDAKSMLADAAVVGSAIVDR